MAELDYQTFSYDFAQGLDQKTDDKYTTKLTEATNIRVEKAFSQEKRFGYAVSGTFSQDKMPQKFIPWKQDFVVLSDGAFENLTVTNGHNHLPGIYSKQSDIWQKSYFECAPIPYFKASTIYKDKGTQFNQSFAVAGVSATSSGVVAFGFQQTNGNSRLNWLNRDNGVLQQNLTLGAFAPWNGGGSVMSRTPGDSEFFYTYVSGNNILAARSSVTSLSASLVFTMSSEISTTQSTFDAELAGNTVCMVYNTTGTTTRATFWNVVSGVTTSITVSAARATCVAIGPTNASSTMFDILYTTLSSTNVGYIRTSLTGSTITSSSALFVENSTWHPPQNLAVIRRDSDGTLFTYFGVSKSGAASLTVSGQIFCNNFTAALASSSLPADGGNFMELASKPVLINDVPNVLVYHYPASQQAYSLMHQDPSLNEYPLTQGKVLYAEAAGQGSSQQILPRWVNTSASRYVTMGRRITQFFSDPLTTSISYSAGLDLIEFDLDPSLGYSSALAADSTIVAGGAIYQYDGNTLLDAGFNIGTPQILSISVTTTGGSVGAGTFALVATSEYVDRNGRRYTSAPSLPMSVTTTGSTNVLKVVVDGAGCARNSIQNSIGSPFINIFRSTANAAGLYYRDVDYITSRNFAISLTVSDTTLSIKDQLYTVGGTLPNFSPNGSRAICAHQNRIWIGDNSNPSRLYYSQENVPGVGLSFADDLTVELPNSTSDEVTALASLDTVILAFKKNAIYYSGGSDQAPNGSGSAPQLFACISDEIGCLGQNQLTKYRDKIYFKSSKGIYSIGHDLQPVYVGAPVESYNGETILSSQVLPLQEEIRFLTSAGNMLVYNAYFDTWSVSTGFTGISDTLVANNIHYLLQNSSTTTSARIHAESRTTYADSHNANADYLMSVATGQFHLAGIQGYQRIRSAKFIGQSVTTSTAYSVIVDIAYNNEGYNESRTVSATKIVGTNNTWTFEIRPTYPKCNSIQFRLREAPGATHGNQFKINNVSLEVGIERQTNKLAPSKRG